eukprot:TRINITY_DN9990_c0_g1_i1.p1 TRINITY_DN9990_c0_g1~~TRINITY_DN9990_c0_g1_i1.p1  ORF type:complete len:160 (-),score=8.47 TRINITY_DN9990_c0_g1_i1:165-644(-)
MCIRDRYEDHYQALLAKNNLNNCPVFGKTVHVNISRHTTIQSTQSKNVESDYVKDYSESPDQRYKIAGSKNFNNVVGPSHFLHLSNLYENVDEQFIRNLFAPVAQMKGFQYFKGTKKMAVAAFSSINDAVNVLMIFHNYSINGRFLKISFSKTTISAAN